ncbi:MAG: hypothetical protein DRI87_08405 [Bacteroidetes bacterium]|nr:MAG: hypothetical protein DRI87_08405 [Bacteroidota bacterium]
MKTEIYFRQLATLLIIFLIYFIFTDCQKKEKTVPVPDPVLENDYEGSLDLKFTNVFPPWSVSTRMRVHIDKDLGIIDVENCTLSYSGDTIINDDSKIERTGQWEIIPIGSLMADEGVDYIKIDAQISVQNDVQRIYGKDNNGNWVLLSEVPFNETPNSQFTFDFDDAVLMGGAIVEVSVATGSIKWTLSLTPVP